MSSYKTLDQWFPNGRGDGRKFTCEIYESGDQLSWFEPMFKSKDPNDSYPWYGITHRGFKNSYTGHVLFKEWHEPKKTKIVTMYMPILKYDHGLYSTSGCYVSKKETEGYHRPVVGYITQEVEVECD